MAGDHGFFSSHKPGTLGYEQDQTRHRAGLMLNLPMPGQANAVMDPNWKPPKPEEKVEAPAPTAPQVFYPPKPQTPSSGGSGGGSNWSPSFGRPGGASGGFGGGGGYGSGGGGGTGGVPPVLAPEPPSMTALRGGDAGDVSAPGANISGPSSFRQGIGRRIMPQDSGALASLRKVY